MIGGIYWGVFTPTEGAAVGAAATGLLSWTVGGMRLAGIKAAILDTAKITGMIFLILIGAEFYSSFLALSQLPQSLAEWVAGTGWPAYAILAAIVLIYLVLGCLMDGLAMMLVTIPVFLPLILKLDFGMPHEAVAVWFGISGADPDRGRTDHAADRAQRLCHQLDGRGRADDRDLQGHRPVLLVGPRAHRHRHSACRRPPPGWRA